MQVAVKVVRRSTQWAIQIIPRDSLPFAWIPISQLSQDVKAGDRNIILEIPDWLAKERRLKRAPEQESEGSCRRQTPLQPRRLSASTS
jgi:hypothetical protein